MQQIWLFMVFGGQLDPSLLTKFISLPFSGLRMGCRSLNISLNSDQRAFLDPESSNALATLSISDLSDNLSYHSSHHRSSC